MYKKSLSYPHLFWMTLFVVVPMLIIFFYSITANVENGEIKFTLDNYMDFFKSTQYMGQFARSVVISLISVVLCIIFGYPVALILANKDRRRISAGKRTTGLLLLFIMPMWMNVMLKLYSWFAILSPGGPVDAISNFFGLGTIEIMGTYSAVIIGIVYEYIPFMILPIYSVLIKIDNSVIEAAEDLGAGPFHVFLKVILPLSLPGVVSGITMVFLPSLTSYYIVKFLGAGKITLIGNVIESYIRIPLWRNFASSISVILMLFAFFAMYLMKLFEKSNHQMSKF